MRQKQLAELHAERKQIEKDLPPSLVSLTQQIEFAHQFKAALESFRTDVAAEAVAARALEKRRRWQCFIDEGCKTFCSAERTLSTDLTTAIETEYRSMYLQITNNPDVVPSLRRAKGSEDLHLRLEKFHGLQDLSATTLLPESYRNALAISIFLSAALKCSTPGRFIVLDDVTSSFDAGHQFSLMELLRTKVAVPARPNGPQVLILSHDGLLEKYFDRQSNTATWHHQRLQGLPPQGSVVSQSQNANRLRTRAVQFLKAGQVQEAEPLIRQYLEFKLLEVVRNLGIPVPLDFSIRDDRKMVENALKACTEAIALHSKAATLVLSPQQVLDLQTVYVPAIVGNWVAHYATGVASSLSPYVLLGVLDSVDRVAECFQYTCNCTGKPVSRYYKALDAKACSC